MSIDTIPLGVLFAGTILVLVMAIEAGHRLGHAAHRRSEDEKESPVSAMVGAVLGLAAFMLAFAFGIVSDRYDAKKGLVRDEANAIRTAYLRSDFLPEPDRAEAKGLLRRYVDVRLTLAPSGNMEPAQVKNVLSETHRIQGRLWDMAVVNARQDMNSDVAALYIDSLNEVIGMQALRVAIGIQARVPGAIWPVLYGITILGIMGVGYQSGIAGSKRSKAGPILALSFAMVFALIASLDRPGSGVITVTQRPLIDLRDSLGTDAVSGER
jgi:hypothetical protein